MLITLTILFGFSSLAAPPLPECVKIEKIETYIKRVNCEKQLELFIEHMGLRESGNQWKVINQIGCMGLYQFSPCTLKHLGYNITPERFAHDPGIFPEALQRQALETLFKSNEIALKDYMGYIGVTIGGVEVTKSGLLAGAHLGGVGAVKLYLLTMGRVNPKDCNQTSIKAYMREFANYGI